MDGERTNVHRHKARPASLESGPVRRDRADLRPVGAVGGRGRRLLRRAGVGSGGPVVELAVGTGRIAVPVAKAGIAVIGVDESEEMLAGARAYAESEGVCALLDLRQGDLREPPVTERVRS